MKKRIAVTGATGFIGSHLVRKLVEDGEKVSVIVQDRKKAEVYFFDILDQIEIYMIHDSIIDLANFLESREITDVVHLATKYITQSTTEDIYDLVKGNILFGMQVLEAMKLAKVKRMVYTGSSWQHYRNQVYCPVNIYAATKQAFEDILHYYSDAEQIHIIILEIYDTYGEKDNRKKLIPNWKRICGTQEKMLLSDGEQKLDYVYITDIVEGIKRAMELLKCVPQAQVYQKKYALSSERVYTLKEIADIFEQVYHTKLPIQWGGKEYRTREVMEPYRNLEKLPGWYAKYELKEGFEQMFQKEEENGFRRDRRNKESIGREYL